MRVGSLMAVVLMAVALMARLGMVFMVEAQPEAADATRLKPGLPLDVRPAPGS